MPANLENSAVATGLEKVSFHSNPKESECEVVQSCLTLCDPMDCSLPGFSVHGIFQARVLEWVSHSPSTGDLPDPRIKPRSPALQADTVPSEPPGKPQEIPKKGSAKECSNYRTTAHISHASQVMLKLLQARLQQYVNRELPGVQAGFRKGRGTRDQIANICWIIEKAREFQKNIYFCVIDYAKAFDCVDHNKLWEILKEMGIPDHLTFLLRNLYAGQEATVRTGHGTTDWFQIGKGVCQGCILSLCLFNLYAEYIIRNTGLEEAQAGIKIAGRNINNHRYADDSTHMTESEEELKSLLMKLKVESEKVGLKINIQKTKIMASGPITSWQIDGETVETVSDFILGGSKITADGDCSHEIKRRLLLGRKDMTNLDSIFKSRDVTLPTKVHLVKAMVFPVVMYGCESWTVKKTEHRRIDAFELWC
uniref:RNA-directed DNA polymerase n=1 Tax=Bos indicus x Bos taurus TaxID=30522 RepID=A0A4W2HS76_BOBOX